MSYASRPRGSSRYAIPFWLILRRSGGVCWRLVDPLSKISTYERLDKANRNANDTPAVGWERSKREEVGGWEVKIKEKRKQKGSKRKGSNREPAPACSVGV